MAISLESRIALRAGIAVGTATAAYGFSFGALSVASGLNVWQTCVLSLFMFSGGSQFALVGILCLRSAFLPSSSSVILFRQPCSHAPHRHASRTF
ncbi:MAG: AzlC family ABC transporter permease [Actinomycetales bacterium]|nr:AzlC family ABC transporter permease [Actinomycetales bacterium]